jgi:hypothetical protein
LQIKGDGLRQIARIGMVGNPWYRYFFARLAVRLKRDYGSVVHIYVPTQAAADLFRSVDTEKGFDEISVLPNSVTLEMPEVKDEQEVIARAQSYERKYNVRYNLLISTDRLYGLGYALGGYHHPRSRQSKDSTYFQAVQVYNTLFDVWERAFESHRLTMIMEASPVQAVIARHYGAAIRSPTPSRVRNLYYWTTDEFGFADSVKRLFESSEPLLSVTDVVEAPFQGALFNKEAERRFSALGVAREVYVQSRNHLMWRMTGYHKGKVYKFRDQVALAFRRRRDFKKVTGPRSVKLADLGNAPYVFYALHVEPELWFQARSPEYTYQLAAIASISRDLPAGVMLVVKEHLPGVGRRPDVFYEQITELKNVRLLDVLEPGLGAVRGARAVVTICGTVGQEAAIAGKPVVALGRHNLYNILSNVRVVTREEDLAPALEWALSGEHEEAEAIREGNRFLGAIEAASFDMETFTYKDPSSFSDRAVEAACRRLLESGESGAGSFGKRQL